MTFWLIIMTAAVFISSGLPAQNHKNLEDNNGFKNYKPGSRFVSCTGVIVINMAATGEKR
jgi:hypothetical protein